MPFSSNYSFVDRALHYLAFGAPFVQKALCELENDLFKSELERVGSAGEVFVTGLPRAGTTLILELLYGTGEFETFTYRDMPFIFAPVLWDKISGSFRKPGDKVERAHGDGMMVSFDSPEAFEEVIWLAFSRRAIVDERTLSPVGREAVTEELASALQSSICKLLLCRARAQSGPTKPRYLSKNNANISRVAVLTELFPTAKIIIAFRDPAAHVGSLMTQHRRFLDEHAADAFSRRYMEWIGHYEFGANFRPINFSGWLDGQPVPTTPDASFWLRYWNAAYGHALEHRTSSVLFDDFDQLLEEGAVALERLAEALALAEKAKFAAAGVGLRAPRTKPVDLCGCPADVRRAAQDIHARLKSLAV
ncbi:MAG: sulfotransferase [Steroidobacteraceae bacterium]